MLASGDGEEAEIVGDPVGYGIGRLGHALPEDELLREDREPQQIAGEVDGDEGEDAEDREADASAHLRGISGGVPGLIAIDRGAGGAVQHHGEEDDGKARDDTIAHITDGEGLYDGLAQTRRTDKRSDDDEGQRRQCRLVDRKDDGALGHGQLHLGEHLPARRPRRLRSLDRPLLKALDRVSGDADADGDGVDHRRDRGRGDADEEDQREGGQVDQRGQHLGQVEPGSKHLHHPVVEAGPHAEGQCDDERKHDGPDRHGEGLHREEPHAEDAAQQHEEHAHEGHAQRRCRVDDEADHRQGAEPSQQRDEIATGRDRDDPHEELNETRDDSPERIEDVDEEEALRAVAADGRS